LPSIATGNATRDTATVRRTPSARSLEATDTRQSHALNTAPQARHPSGHLFRDICYPIDTLRSSASNGDITRETERVRPGLPSPPQPLPLSEPFDRSGHHRRATGNACQRAMQLLAGTFADTNIAATATPPLNPRSVPTSWFHPLAYKRFHVLLNSLFKVLCNFPSRYLFAIGLAVIFSLNRSLPATLGCTFKQPDSNVPRLARPARVAMGLPPALGKSCSKELATLALIEASTPTPTWHRTARRNRRQAFTLGSSRFTRRY
jgi:hypothetical protein